VYCRMSVYWYYCLCIADCLCIAYCLCIDITVCVLILQTVCVLQTVLSSRGNSLLKRKHIMWNLKTKRVMNFLDRKQAMEKDWRIQFANNKINNNNNYSNYNNESFRNNIYTIVGISIFSHILYKEDRRTIMRRLTTGIHSEKCVVRRVIEYT